MNSGKLLVFLFQLRISYHNLAKCPFFLLQSLRYVTMKALKLKSSEGWSVIALHLQVG